jgi:hypothetical protein
MKSSPPNETATSHQSSAALARRHLHGAGLPHRPAAALALVLASKPADRAEQLLLEALASQPDPAVRSELAVRFAGAHPDRADGLGTRGALSN